MHVWKMLFVYKILLGKTCKRSLLESVGCGWLNCSEIEVKGIGSESLTGSVWIRMLVAGRLYNRAVECMFFVSSECLVQLMKCDTITQCCSALHCVAVWQAVQTDRHDSVLLKVQFFYVVVL